MENQFSILGISEPIVKALDKMGFTTPTDVQRNSIPHILASKDLIVMSKTGSGKTGAFGIPVLQSVDEMINEPQALILTPTRELAVQVDSDLKLMSKNLKLRTMAVYGQHNINTEIEAIQKGVSVVTGTPGRVFDHISKKTLSTKAIKYLILDEADRMLDMGFIDQVVKIIKALPRNRVTLLFSATMPSEIQKICREYMKDPITIELESDTKTVDTIKQLYYRVKPDEKRTQLDRILKIEQPDSCMVFCNTRHTVDRVHDYLYHRGYVADSLHGANTQRSRTRTIENFKKGMLQILVATDVAARGIHIDDLTLVINYDVPSEKDSYVHRIGRTGRAGNGGKAITLVTSSDIRSLYDIEEHTGVLIDEEDLPTDEMVRNAILNADGKWVGIEPKPRTQSHHNKPAQSHHGRSSSQTGGKDRNANRDYKPVKNQKNFNSESRSNNSSRPKQDGQGNKTSQSRNNNQARPPHQPRLGNAPRPAGSSRPSGSSRPNTSSRPQQAGTTTHDQKPISQGQRPLTPKANTGVRQATQTIKPTTHGSKTATHLPKVDQSINPTPKKSLFKKIVDRFKGVK